MAVARGLQGERCGGAAGRRYRARIAIPDPRRVSLCRALSKLGVLSRSLAVQAIVAGRVSVDDRIERDPGHRVDLRQQHVALDGQPVGRVVGLVLLMHKPCGVVTTLRDERGRRTVCDLLPRDLPFVAPVGRLDLDSSGLLLFTNDTALAAAISGPDSRLPKVYEVEFDLPLRPEHSARMQAGMQLADGTLLRPVEVVFAAADDRRRARLVLREGKNRQIRRMAEGCGRTVVRLHRVAIGPLLLGDLAVGAVRRLGAVEVDELRAAVGG